jgi:hypothetical protein
MYRSFQRISGATPRDEFKEKPIVTFSETAPFNG